MLPEHTVPSSLAYHIIDLALTSVVLWRICLPGTPSDAWNLPSIKFWWINEWQNGKQLRGTGCLNFRPRPGFLSAPYLGLGKLLGCSNRTMCSYHELSGWVSKNLVDKTQTPDSFFFFYLTSFLGELIKIIGHLVSSGDKKPLEFLVLGSGNQIKEGFNVHLEAYLMLDIYSMITVMVVTLSHKLFNRLVYKVICSPCR